MGRSNNGSSITLGFVGDIMLARDVERHYIASPRDFSMPDVRACLSDCDYLHGNLETPVSDVGTPHHSQDPNVCFCAKPATLGVLQTIGLDSVSLANNHVLDYGEHALRRTLDLVGETGIARLGAGENYGEANKPLIHTVGDFRIAVIASNFINSASTRKAMKNSPGAADSSIRRLVSSIRSVRRDVDFVIMSIHWGLEYSFYPLPYIQRGARRLIDAGATLVVGHGPHYVQPIERYKDGAIVYSLGNFIFDEPFKFANISYILKANLGHSGVNFTEVHPLVIENHVPRLSTDWRAKRTRDFVECGASNFSSKSKRFWQNLSNTYFRDMLGRAVKTRSLKYLTINPLRFYLDVGLKNYLAKLGLWR